MILSSSFLSLPRPLCRDALWRGRGAVSDGRGAWCATPPDGVRSNPKWCFWVTIARRAEYSSLEERLRARGARDAGFDDGRLGRTSVPWVAREYLADAGTNATRANRAELSSIGTRSHLCPNQKKNLFSESRTNPVRATRLLSNLESANFGELLESQTLPQTSRLSVFARDGRAGQCACALAPRRATRDACFALRKRARPHSSRRSRTSTDTRESDARGERVEASEPTRDRRGGVVHDRLAFSRQSLAE